MSRLQRQVEAFHALMGQRDPATPTDPSQDTRYLRAHIDSEEFAEEVVALVGTEAARRLFAKAIDKLESKRGREPGDLVEIVDGSGDSSVVAAGTLLACGVTDDAIHAVIMRSNMAKVGGGRDAAGKWLKPKNWTPPDIATELVVQGWRRGGGL